ncbi:MAG: S8 family serine peptidase [Rhodobacteraceae bacterium]|nr:S8 family serine peptidase [Paracoccaceae bacterium]
MTGADHEKGWSGRWVQPSFGGLAEHEALTAQGLFQETLTKTAVPSSAIVYGPRRKIDLRVTDVLGRPVAGATVTVLTAIPDGGDCVETDTAGRAILSVAALPDTAQTLLLVEAAGYVTLRQINPRLVETEPFLSQHNTAVLEPVPEAEGDRLCWGVEAMRLHMVPSLCVLGASLVRVAVISCHPWGKVRAGCEGCVIAPVCDDQLVTDWKRPKACAVVPETHTPLASALTQILGSCAPGVEIHHLSLPLRAHVTDLIAALDHCARHQLDLVCLAVSCPHPDPRLLRALRSARASGLVVVAPVGETGWPVRFPAAWPEVLGVGAVGRGADRSNRHLLADAGSDGFAAFARAASGRGLDVLAPGVGLNLGPRTVSGTVLAAAFATGFLARLLQTTPNLAVLPRTEARVLALHAALRAHCVDLGLNPMVQGAGLPIWGSKGKLRLSPAHERTLAEQAQAVIAAIARQGLTGR